LWRWQGAGRAAPLLLALLVQGATGVLQLSGYLGYQGADYVAFAAAFVTGAMLANILSLNTEALLLSGPTQSSGRRLVVGVAAAGLLMLAADVVVLRRGSPSALTFTSWFLCGKFFLARHARQCPRVIGICAGGVLMLAALAMRWNATVCMAISLATLLLLALSVPGPAAERDDGLVALLRASVSSFVGYLPHVIAGVLLAYADRFSALHFYEASSSEFYLRLMQVASLAAFGAYPLVYSLRNELVAATAPPTGARLAALAALLAVGIGTLFLVALFGMESLRGSQALLQRAHWQEAAVMMVLATVLAQLYQVTSMRIFVERRYGFINRGTILAALIAVLCASLMMVAGVEVRWLALASAAGWGTLCWRVAGYFRRERLMPADGSAGPAEGV
jgi:hypothetical protein